jgi:hypothetical protein
VENVIIKHELAVVALQEVSRPFADISSDAHTFRSFAQAPRQGGPHFQVFGAQNGTATGKSRAEEYPFIMIDERYVLPAGDHTMSTWHGYVQ